MPRKKKDGIKISYLISRPIVEKLDLYCEETGLPKTYVIEQALLQYFQELYKDADVEIKKVGVNA